MTKILTLDAEKLQVAFKTLNEMGLKNRKRERRKPHLLMEFYRLLEHQRKVNPCLRD